jgi:hypothetical protein
MSIRAQDDRRSPSRSRSADRRSTMNKLHASLAVISAAAVLGTTGALALPAVAGAQQDADVNAAGKTVGFDML